MRAWLVLCLLHWLSPGHAKRVDPSMVDPLMRRSALDKNFMRFGRSSPPYPSGGDAEDDARGTEASKEDNFLRSMRGKDELSEDVGSREGSYPRFGRGKQDNFMRFGRGKQDNFMRFGRGKQDNFMRFGRGKQDFMRFGRGKQDFMRFGRGKQDDFMRFGRGKQDNFMRFGRGKQDFMRFGRGKQDNFMRFGRGKQDNFMRFGKSPNEDVDFFFDPKDSDMERATRGNQDNYMRFGKSLSEDPDKSIPLGMRSTSSFIRYGRARPDNFMRFGKSTDFPSAQTSDLALIPSSDVFARERKSKDSNLLRYERKLPNNDDSFIRFGRSSNEREEDSPALIPPRLKRSVMDEIFPSNMQDDVDGHRKTNALPDDLEDEYSALIDQVEYSNRRKRSPSHHSSTPSPYTEEDASVDYIATKLRLDSSTVPELQSSLFSAGIPNVIVGPEFSLLPNLNPPSSMRKSKSGDKSFLRLG